MKETEKRLNEAGSKVRTILQSGPDKFGNVLAWAALDSGVDELWEIERFCLALVDEMKDGAAKTYLSTLAVAVKEHAVAWEAHHG